MHALRRLSDLPAGTAAAAWLRRVLPEPEEHLRSRWRRALEALEQGGCDADATRLAGEPQAPAGVAVVSLAGDRARIELVAVRDGLRGRGLGRRLLTTALDGLGRRRLDAVVAEPVDSREAAWIHLLASAGFDGRSLGSLRMRRRLAGPLPVSEVPAGYRVRALQPGEEAAWVALKNACFPEDAAWTLDTYRRELSGEACYEADRVLVAERDGRLAGTTIAWEADYGDGRVGLIHWVGVDPAHRGQGLARALNSRALALLAERGYAEAWLNTSRQRQAAVALYEGLGFQVHRELLTYSRALQAGQGSAA